MGCPPMIGDLHFHRGYSLRLQESKPLKNNGIISKASRDILPMGAHSHALPCTDRRTIMPVYEFLCATCGSFEQRRSLQDAGEPMACPMCQIVATRIYSTAGLILTSGTVRRRIERSAEPRVVKRLSPAESSPALLQRSGRTPPWQLGHASYTGTAPPGLQRL